MIKVKNVLLTALVATFMVGGIASVEEASVNANAQTVHVHHAERHAKKHHKKASKKHAKKHSKKRVVKKHVRKVAKKHVAKKHARKTASKKVTNKVAKKGTRKLPAGVTSTGTDKYGYSGEIIHTPKWSVYHGDGSQKSLDEYRLNMAKHDPEIRKVIQKYGLHDFTNDEVSF